MPTLPIPRTPVASRPYVRRLANLLFTCLAFYSMVATSPIRAESEAHPAELAESYEEARSAWLRFVRRLPQEQNPDARWRTYAELQRSLVTLVEERPGIIEPFEAGRTVRGRPIWGFRVHHPTSPITKKVLVFGAIHPLEWIGGEIVTESIRELAINPVEGLEVTFIPVLNVDGRRVVEADHLRGDDLYRRTNANGVDLNRDFAVNRHPTTVWRHVIPNRYTTSPAPLSQPETQAIDHLAATERFDVAISFHAFGGYIYHPWAGAWKRPPDWEEFQALGRMMESGQKPRAYRTWQLSRWAFFFRGCGMELDHLYGQYGTRAFLIEATRSGLSIFHPEEWKSDFRLYNPRDPSEHRDRGVEAMRALFHGLMRPDQIHGGAH